jgi:hypothetical protein
MISFRLLLVAVFAILILPGTGRQLEAAIYYVSPSGSGTTCSQSSPCALSTGLGKVAAGDEVVLLDGTYTSSLVVNKGGASGKHVVVRAQNNGKAIVRVTNARVGRVFASYVTVRGIVFDGGGTGGNRGGVRIGPGDETTLSSTVRDVIFENNVVKDMRAACVGITSGEYNIIVRHNTISRCGMREFWGEGLYIGNRTDPLQTVYNLEVYGNDVSGFTENAIETKKYTRNAVIRDNIFRNQVLFSDYGGDPAEGNDGTVQLDGHSISVYNNILYNNKAGMADFVVEPEAGIKVFNNIVYNGVSPSSAAIRMKNWSKSWPSKAYPPSQVYNNTFYNLVSHNCSSVDSSILIIRNNLGINLTGNIEISKVSSSHFQDAVKGNFRLKAGAIAIDYGALSPYANVDYDGKGVFGTCRDYGAFEYGLSAPAPPSGLKVLSTNE